MREREKEELIKQNRFLNRWAFGEMPKTKISKKRKSSSQEARIKEVRKQMGWEK